MFGLDTYDKDVELFEKVLAAKADELLVAEDLAVVYIGRGSCPFCRKFAKKLSGLADQIKTKVYYIDSEDFSDDNIDTFREKYNVVTVPGFIVKNNGSVEVRCDSSMPEEEILAMVK
ncbi:MAG: conjugal transfer protein TraF [Sarcina sp.]